ncbi:MAG: reverse transcriptase-like protein [Nitrosopumilus sp.]|nr:reverse transcriptase-like protein [Nitrosopumilus sp.]MDH3515835.1 reverse transcriptase-like protein [Nitrosopumilus sp.]MDH5416709.1 reverse transcriptase-like protein [Nitrosopumilus sp.]MDH5554443.1 reverse transcriptase-like protein [Nitrosopumilus sp.]
MNNQTEYLTLISTLNKYIDSNEEFTIYSDSKNTVNQLNHDFVINNEQLRTIAQETRSVIGKFSNISIKWIPRRANLVGKC